jgi:hypothetical protein
MFDNRTSTITPDSRKKIVFSHYWYYFLSKMDIIRESILNGWFIYRDINQFFDEDPASRANRFLLKFMGQVWNTRTCDILRQQVHSKTTGSYGDVCLEYVHNTFDPIFNWQDNCFAKLSVIVGSVNLERPVSFAFHILFIKRSIL